MTLTIHRGSNEIGGSCVEVCTAKTRIILDFGMPLTNIDGSVYVPDEVTELSINNLIKEKILPNIPSLFGEADGKETALLISHAHQDHYGLVSFVNSNIPVYLGKATHKLIELTTIFGKSNTKIENPVYFENQNSFSFGDIEITPCLMDHSSYDAYAFLLKGEGRTVLYTGDFRAHGRKRKHFYKFLHIMPKNPDLLLMEGTSLSRPRQKSQTEEELETELIKTFKECKGINLVYVSGQNIDRLVTFFRACRRSGRIFVIDFYIATVLFEMAKLGGKLPYPSKGFPEIRVLFPDSLTRRMEKKNRNDLIDKFKEYEITLDEINKNLSRVVMPVRSSMECEIHKLKDLSGGNLIYSMWEGYRKNDYTERFLSNIEKRGAAIINIHTSGHADYNTLKKLIGKIKPKELVPIHTTVSSQYQALFTKVKVRPVIDGEIINIEDCCE